MAERKNSIGGVAVPSIRQNPEVDVFDNMTAFSPPSEESRFLIQYPNRRNSKNGFGFDTISEDYHYDEPTRPQRVQTQPPTVDLANHLDPCKKYIVNKETIIKGSKKGMGTDDGFKDAVCGNTLVKVAEKMMINKQFVKADIDDIDDEFFQISSIEEQREMDQYRHLRGGRRGSGSLPASPKFERKGFFNNPNPYFTITKQEDNNRGDISFLTSLFGITARKDISSSQLSMSSLKMDEPSTSGSSIKIPTQNFTAISSESAKDTKPKSGFFAAQPKPSELREMNFLSPTSM